MKKKNKSQFLQTGYISKAHGIQGDILICPFHSKAGWPNSIKQIFIGKDLLAFSVKKYKKVKEGWIFSLENIHCRKEAEKLKSQSIFLPKKIFRTKSDDFIYLAELMGFQVENEGKNIGQIQSFKSDKFQDFLLIKKEKKEILIPFVSTYIQNIQFDKKKLSVALPKNFLKTFIQISYSKKAI